MANVSSQHLVLSLANESDERGSEKSFQPVRDIEPVLKRVHPYHCTDMKLKQEPSELKYATNAFMYNGTSK